MARPRARSNRANGVPSQAVGAPESPSAKTPRAATLDEVLEQVRKIAAAERELRNLQGSLKTLRDGLQGLVDQLSSEDQEIYLSILSVEPTRGPRSVQHVEIEPAGDEWPQPPQEA